MNRPYGSAAKYSIGGCCKQTRNYCKLITQCCELVRAAVIQAGSDASYAVGAATHLVYIDKMDWLATVTNLNGCLLLCGKQFGLPQSRRRFHVV